MGERRWKPRRWVWGLWSGLPLVAVAALGGARSPGILAVENGLLETSQAALWLVAGVAAVAVAWRLEDAVSRARTLLLGAMAVAALFREFDLHTALNPETLGPLGVRYRLDWWLGSEVPWQIKAVWAAVFAPFMFAACYGLWLARGPVRWSRARPRLVAAAAVLLLIGFAMDDLLRTAGAPAVRLLVEELAELFAAVVFLAAVLAPESAAWPPTGTSVRGSVRPITAP